MSGIFFATGVVSCLLTLYLSEEAYTAGIPLPNSDSAPVAFASEGFEGGLVMHDPRPAAEVLDVGVRALAGGSIAVGASSNAGLMLLFPSFLRASIAPPSADATQAAAAAAAVRSAAIRSAAAPAEQETEEDSASSWLWHQNEPYRFAVLFDAWVGGHS